MCSSAEAEQCDELCEKVNVRDTNSTSHEEIYCLCRFDVDDHHISVRVKPRDENDGVIVNCTSKTLTLLSSPHKNILQRNLNVKSM